MEGRSDIIEQFLQAAGWGQAHRRPLPGDASFRRYERLNLDGARAMLMDAPPPQENVAAFHAVQSELLSLDLSAPQCLGLDSEAGLMLLEDFGDRTFTRVLDEGAEPEPLYRLATDVLIALHSNWKAVGRPIPPYDAGPLEREVLLLTDWYYQAATGAVLGDAERRAYLAAWRPLWPVAQSVPLSLVLRDYHVDNLMLLEGRGGPKACGLLDFQDALVGPVTYDLVSLLEDARRNVPAALAEEMLARYLAAFPALDREAFGASYAVMGAQRNAKIIGIFTRLSRRDGKDGYLRLIPHVWRLLEGDLQHPALADVRDWFAAYLPPDRRRAPDPLSAEKIPS